jgi:hypothetical protein
MLADEPILIGRRNLQAKQTVTECSAYSKQNRKIFFQMLTACHIMRPPVCPPEVNCEWSDVDSNCFMCQQFKLKLITRVPYTKIVLTVYSVN